MTARRIEIPLAGNNKEKSVKTQLLCALALGLAATASGAAAQASFATDSDALTVRTTVAPFCGNLAAADPIELGALTGAEGFVVDQFAGAPKYESPGYYCNAPSKVTLTATPLKRTPAIAISDTSSFVDRIDYKASLAWGAGIAGSIETLAGAPVVITATQPHTGLLQLTLSDPQIDDTARPIAGDYAGSVTVTVTAGN